MSSLADLFPETDYEFRLTLRRSDPREFFRAREPSGALLAERRKWIRAEPEKYTALQAEGEPLCAEFAECCRTWGVSTATSVRELGRDVEPDFLLLSRDEAGAFRLRGGALCFPTGWALEEKLGQTLDDIHAVVPGLNPAIGASIRTFLEKLKPGVAFLRDNWGITATDELNLHPSRALPAPGLPLCGEQLWLRVEHQALVALPRSAGVLFGIRIALHRLDAVRRDAGVARRLARALMTMPAPVVSYKRLETVRGPLIEFLVE